MELGITVASPVPTKVVEVEDLHRTCSQCGIQGAAGSTMKRCGQCRVPRYCGAACQKKHWKAGHKTECVAKDTGAK
jgi:hypothetical protein